MDSRSGKCIFATCPLRVLFGRFRYVACGYMGSWVVPAQPRHATYFLAQLLLEAVGFRLNAIVPTSWDNLPPCCCRTCRGRMSIPHHRRRGPLFY